jgi:hypothetical protein
MCAGPKKFPVSLFVMPLGEQDAAPLKLLAAVNCKKSPKAAAAAGCQPECIAQQKGSW